MFKIVLGFAGLLSCYCAHESKFQSDIDAYLEIADDVYITKEEWSSICAGPDGWIELEPNIHIYKEGSECMAQ